MANLWLRFRGLPVWAQIPIGIVTGLFALGVVVAPFSEPADEPDVVASTATPSTSAATVTTSDPARTTTTALSSLPAGDDTAVTRVTDGDSLVVTDGTRIRLIGIDTPEIESDDCFSADATEHTDGLVGPGTRVRLVYDVERLDRYGRTLAYVYRLPDGLFVNLALARDGFAQQLTIPPNVRYAEQLGLAVSEARIADRGLWSSCRTTTTVAPAPVVTPRPAPGVTINDPVPAFDDPSTAAGGPADETTGCHPSYAGACVPIASDVDCGGGSGNGPAYTYETDILVVGDDVYGLDGNDNDGIGCES